MKQAGLVLTAVLLSASCALAVAQGQSGYRAQVSKAQHVEGAAATGSATHRTSGKPGKPSSFAPHPTRQRVFGAPIQSPIMRHVAPARKPRPRVSD
jgi:hypothetical protein